MKLNYKGNKNSKEKNKYSEVPEVLKKNLIRSLRRYLKELYTTDNDLNKASMSPLARRERVRTLYEKRLKSQALNASNLSENKELGVLHVLSILIQEGISFRSDTICHRKLKFNLGKLIRTYSKKMYQRVKKVDGFIQLLILVKQAGHLEKMIEAYPILAKSKEAYQDAMENMIHEQ